MDYTQIETQTQEHTDKRLFYDVASGTYSYNYVWFNHEYVTKLAELQAADIPAEERWRKCNALLSEHSATVNQALAILRAIRKIDADSIPF